MVTVYNRGYCFNCGEPTDDDYDVGRVRLYCCTQRECQRELRDMEQEEREERDCEWR